MRISLKHYPYVWLSLLIHLLCLSPIFIYFNNKSSREIPYYYVPDNIPSYLDAKAFLNNQAQQKAPDAHSRPVKKSSQDGLLTSKVVESLSNGLAISPPILSAQSFLSQKTKPQDAIHLVGDKLEDDPLRNLLGRAITAHLRYPKLAQELQLRGIVTIGMTLFPDGQAVNIKMLKSSRQNMLDVAALEAIQAISPVVDVNLYLKKAKYLVINIIFR